MTRKHFKAIADALKDLKPPMPYSTDDLETWGRTVRAMAAMCRRENPRFDTSRFYEACGYDD